MIENSELLGFRNVEISNPKKEHYVQQALKNLAVTSRTAKGVIDISASVDKAAKINQGLSSVEISDRAQNNFRATMEYLYDEKDRDFLSSEDLKSFVEDVAKKINSGITNEGVLLRSGEDSAKYPYTRIKDLPHQMDNFYTEMLLHINNSTQDPEHVAGWIEYRIDLTDHFFVDGCGKVSKAISSWWLMRSNHDLPVYRSRSELYSNAPTVIRGTNPEINQREFDQWCAYYKSLFIAKDFS